MTSLTVPRSYVTPLTERIDASLERHFWCWTTLFLVLFFGASIARDIGTKMWMDEFYTLFVARQSSPGEIVNAIKEGCDGSPPLYATIVHALLPVAKNDALAVRLPSTLGFCAMILFLLGYAHRRLPAAYAFIVALFAAKVCIYYATEGRPYGLVLGCAAGALFFWQRAAEGIRRNLTIPLLALCLALMVALHYYAIFFLVPLGIAELVRARISGKLDTGILSSMLPALLVLGLHYPLITATKESQGYFWGRPKMGHIHAFYQLYSFNILILLSLALLLLAVLRNSPARPVVRETNIPAHEWVAAGTLALMPPVVVLISMYTTHAFVDRYILWVAIGFALLAGTILCVAVRGSAAVGVTFLGVLLGLFALQQVSSIRSMSALRVGENIYHNLQMLPDGTEPIAVPDAHAFLQLSYYAEPRIRDRLVFPASSELDALYTGIDTHDRLLLALRDRTNLHIEDYAAFVAEHPRFVVAAEADEYLPWHLVGAGYRVVPIRLVAGKPVLFEVETPDR